MVVAVVVDWLLSSSVAPLVHVRTLLTVVGVVPSEQISTEAVVVPPLFWSVEPSVHWRTPLTVCGMVPSEQVSLPVEVVPPEKSEFEFDVLVEVVKLPNASVMVPAARVSN